MSRAVDTETGEIVETLSDDEAADLGRLEQVIYTGMETFVEVGAALAEIRDRKLYRESDATFAAYCHRAWDLAKSQVYRLIDAAEIVHELETSPQGDIPLPTSERQTRVLKQVEKEDRAEVMRRAAADGPPTTESVRKAAAEIDPALKLRQEQEEARERARAEKAAREKAAREEADAVMATRIAERRQHDPRVRAEHLSQTVRGFLLSEAHTLLDIHPAEAAESLASGDESSTLADAERLRTWLTDFCDYVTNGLNASVTDLRSVK